MDYHSQNVLMCEFLLYCIYPLVKASKVKPGLHMMARSRKESQRVAIKVVKFACDSLQSYGNRLKLCLRLLAIAVAGSRRDRKFSISATHCDSLRSIAINGNHCSQILQFLAITTLLFRGIISFPLSQFWFEI